MTFTNLARLRTILYVLLVASSSVFGQHVCPDGTYLSVRSSTVKIPGNPMTMISEGKITISEGKLVWIEREDRPPLRFHLDKKSKRWLPENLAEIAKRSGEENPFKLELVYAGLAETLDLHIFRLTVTITKEDGENAVETSYLYLQKAE